MAEDDTPNDGRGSYSMGYAAGKKHARLTARDMLIEGEVARRVHVALAAATDKRRPVNIDAPDGQALTILLPDSLNADRLLYFRQQLGYYFDRLELILKQKETP